MAALGTESGGGVGLKKVGLQARAPSGFFLRRRGRIDGHPILQVGVHGADGFRAIQPRKKTKRREASVGCFVEVGLERPNSWGAGLVQN
jgi:hypothetical protein